MKTLRVSQTRRVSCSSDLSSTWASAARERSEAVRWMRVLGGPMHTTSRCKNRIDPFL
jgi:hypothetical protein